jgi:hypothetical protein
VKRNECRRHDQNFRSREPRRLAALRLVRRSRERQRELKNRPGTRRALDTDAATHLLDYAIANGEPQPGAAELTSRPIVGLLEFQKDAPLSFRCNSDARIAHGKSHLIVTAAALYRDGKPSLLRELDRVASEVEEDLAQSSGIAGDHSWQLVIHIVGDVEPLCLCARRDEFDRFLDQCREIEGAR